MGNNQNQYQYHSNNPLGDLIVDAALIGVTAALKSHHQNKNHSNNGKNQSQNPQKYTNSQTKTPSLSKYNTENPSIKGPGNESQVYYLHYD